MATQNEHLKIDVCSADGVTLVLPGDWEQHSIMSSGTVSMNGGISLDHETGVMWVSFNDSARGEIEFHAEECLEKYDLTGITQTHLVFSLKESYAKLFAYHITQPNAYVAPDENQRYPVSTGDVVLCQEGTHGYDFWIVTRAEFEKIPLKKTAKSD